MNSYEKFNIDWSAECFKEVFGEDYLVDYQTSKVIEINGKKFEHRMTGYEINYTHSSPRYSEIKVDGYIRKFPTEKELLEEKIHQLKVELKQAKRKLEEIGDE